MKFPAEIQEQTLARDRGAGHGSRRRGESQSGEGLGQQSGEEDANATICLVHVGQWQNAEDRAEDGDEGTVHRGEEVLIRRYEAM